MALFENAISQVLTDEGSIYTDDPSDSGGATKFGVSLKFYKEINSGATDEDIRNLTRDMAIEIYRKCFWDNQKYSFIANQKLATKVFDIAVNISPIHANKMLQKAVNAVNNYHEFSAQYVDVDGILGARSLYAVNTSPSSLLLSEFKDQVKAYYMAVFHENPKDAKYLSGWLKRAAEDN